MKRELEMQVLIAQLWRSVGKLSDWVLMTTISEGGKKSCSAKIKLEGCLEVNDCWFDIHNTRSCHVQPCASRTKQPVYNASANALIVSFKF